MGWAVGWVDGTVAGATAPGAAVASVWSAVPWMAEPSDTSEVPVAGTAMGAPKTEINHSWGSGYGVRLLDRLVAEHYER